MKTNLTNWLCGLCAILLIAVLTFQFKQQGRLDAVQRWQETSASATSQQQQEQRDGAAKLANQVTNLGASMESRLTQSKQQAEAFLTKLQEQGSTNNTEMLRGIFQVSYDLRDELTKMRTGQIAASQTNQALVAEQGRVFQAATAAMANQVSAWKTGVGEMRQQLDDLS